MPILFNKSQEQASTCITRSATSNHGYGVDTLHLSYTGLIRPELHAEYVKLKHLAQSEDFDTRTIVTVGNQTFTVAPKGAGKFGLVLRNDFFFVMISKNRSKLPILSIQVKSEAFYHYDWDMVHYELSEITSYLLSTIEKATISRLDLFCDFSLLDTRLDSYVGQNLVSRSRLRRVTQYGGIVSALECGMGSSVQMRLYDKTREIKVSKKFHWRDRWLENGWCGELQVWRLEYELKTEALRQMSISTVSDVEALFTSVWSYLTHEWSRIVVQTASDTRTRRWSIAPWWVELSNLFSSGVQPVKRQYHHYSSGNADYRFRNGLSGIAQHMALKGITDPVEGAESFVHAAWDYHGDFQHYLQKKIERFQVAYSIRPKGRVKYQPELVDIPF